MSAMITELLDSKAESDDVGFGAELAWMSCQIERAFRFVEVLKKAAADPSNRSFGEALKVVAVIVAVSLHDVFLAVGHRLREIRARQDHLAQEVGHLLPLQS